MANDPSDPILEIRGLRFPLAFVTLWTNGCWKQPAPDQIHALIPWLQGSIAWIEEMQWMLTRAQYKIGGICA